MCCPANIFGNSRRNRGGRLGPQSSYSRRYGDDASHRIARRGQADYERDLRDGALASLLKFQGQGIEQITGISGSLRDGFDRVFLGDASQ